MTRSTSGRPLVPSILIEVPGGDSDCVLQVGEHLTKAPCQGYAMSSFTVKLDQSSQAEWEIRDMLIT